MISFSTHRASEYIFSCISIWPSVGTYMNNWGTNSPFLHSIPFNESRLCLPAHIINGEMLDPTCVVVVHSKHRLFLTTHGWHLWHTPHHHPLLDPMYRLLLAILMNQCIIQFGEKEKFTYYTKKCTLCFFMCTFPYFLQKNKSMSDEHKDQANIFTGLKPVYERFMSNSTLITIFRVKWQKEK